MKYYLAHNNKDIFHYGEILETQEIETGQSSLEFFDDLTSLENRLSNFGITYNLENNKINNHGLELPSDLLDSVVDKLPEAI